MATIIERNARLDSLKAAVDDWADRELKRIENEGRFIDAVLAGRGARRAGTANLSQLSVLVEDEVKAFLRVHA